jgi:RNA polymerase sigma-70 factor (ECF subfamily)
MPVAAPQTPLAVPRPVLDFETIYAAHFDFVWRSLRRLGVPDAALDDAAQEVFLVVYRRLQEFEGRSQLKTWLFRIAIHTAQHHLRSLSRRPTVAVTDVEAEASPAHGTPHDELAKRQAVEVLYRLLDQLEPAKRTVFVMADLEQMSAPEIASVLDVPLNTVYSRLRVARQEFDDNLRRHKAATNGAFHG